MNIFKLEFKSQLRSMLLWGGIVSLALIGFMSFFPAMQNQAMKEITAAKLQALPPAMLAAFGITEMTDFTVLTNFYSMIMQYINLAICIFATILGANALIKEESDGTIEYLYSQPVTRSDIVKNKMLANVCAFAILPIVLSVVTCVLFAIFNDSKIAFSELLQDIAITYIGLFFAGIIFMSIGFLASAILKSSKQASPFALAIVFGTFIIGIVSTMIKDLEFLLVLSPLDTVKPTKLMADGFDMAEVIVGIIIIVVCATLSFILYQKKDLKV